MTGLTAPIALGCAAQHGVRSRAPGRSRPARPTHQSAARGGPRRDSAPAARPVRSFSRPATRAVPVRHVARAVSSGGAAEVEGSTGLPLVGETLEVVQDPIGFFVERKAKYGPVFRTSFAGDECIAVCDAKMIQDILAQEHKTVKFEILKSIDRLTTSNLFGTPEAKASADSVQKEHKADRQFLMEYFSPAAIASYYPYMQQSMADRIAKWSARPQVSMAKEAKDFAFDVMNSQLAGVQFNAKQLKELDSLWHDFTNGTVDMLGLDLPFTDFGRGRRAGDRIGEIIEDALVETYGADLESRDFSGNNMATGLFLQKNEDGSWKHSTRDVAMILRAILFAGHETTANAICVMMQFVTKHPQVLNRLKQEQAELAAKYGEEITPRAMEGTYTEATAVEVMRLQNIDKTTRNAGILFRRVLADMEVGGKIIPKGSKLLLAQAFATYSIEKFLPTVEEFDPERWMGLKKTPINATKSMGATAFGSGPRVCAGEALAWAEMKVYLSMMVRYADWSFINPDAKWMKGQGSLMKLPEDGMATSLTLKSLDVGQLGKADELTPMI